jgi:hypothetical protein
MGRDCDNMDSRISKLESRKNQKTALASGHLALDSRFSLLTSHFSLLTSPSRPTAVSSLQFPLDPNVDGADGVVGIYLLR